MGHKLSHQAQESSKIKIKYTKTLSYFAVVSTTHTETFAAAKYSPAVNQQVFLHRLLITSQVHVLIIPVTLNECVQVCTAHQQLTEANAFAELAKP